MKNVKSLLAGVVLASAAQVAQASDINIGGVVWDPDYNAGIEMDFIGRFDFTQWFSTTNEAVGDITSFDSAVTLQEVIDAQIAAAGAQVLETGLYLSGVGEFKEINGDEGSISSATGTALDSFCPGCELTYAFGGLGLNADNTFDASNAWAQIYVDHTPDFDVPPGTPGNPATNALADGDSLLFLDLRFDTIDFIALGQGIASGFVDATLSIVGGIAANNFDPGTLEYNASAFNNSLGAATRYSTGGTGSINGNSIPEPGSLAVLGLGLMALFGFGRRKA